MAFQSIKFFALELDGPEDTVVLGRGVAAAHWLENRSVGVNTVYNDHTSKITYFRKKQHLIRVGTESIQTPLNFSLFVILQPFAKII
uniref:Arrestin-like N-terminal domain-containing protein n=1 Tax=Sinocyclocheilus grahami TaxID=75366 RepID=A0A672R9K6_SINGR